MRLNSWLKSLFARLSNSANRAGIRRRKSPFRLDAGELLETRQLLSGAQMLPDGPATRANTFTTGSQFSPDMAMNASGDYVVVWQSTNQQSNPNLGIYAQRYNSQGAAVGAEIHVNSNTSFSNTDPKVAIDAAGDFVVTWDSNKQDGSDYGIYGRRFNASGTALGGDFRINTTTLLNQMVSSVAMDSAGDFVVSWQSQTQTGNHEVEAQRYHANGVAAGGEFQVNLTTTHEHFSGAVAMDSAGDFLITWRDFVTQGAITTEGNFGQLFHSDGTRNGSVIKFNSSLGLSSVAMDGDGNFVVTSVSDDSTGHADVSAQRFNANGVAQGASFTVNTYTTGTQFFADVAIDSTGDFVVVWENYTTAALNTAEGVHGQRFDKNGVPEGTEFEVAKASPNQFLLFPSVVMEPTGDFVVAWQGYGQSGGSQYDVYTQRYHSDFAPVLSNVGSTTLMDNSTSPISITTTLTVSDVDDTNLDGATVKISNHYQMGQDQLLFFSSAKITGSWDPATGILTLTGTDSVANYQAALRSVRFQTTGAKTSARTISFQVSDGQQGSNIVSRVVDLPPKVLSIVPVTASPSSSSTVKFRVTFSEPVGNVTANDFTLAESGVVGGTIAIGGINDVYTLTISGLEGRGTLGVNLTNFSSIIDAAHNVVTQGFVGSTMVMKIPGPTVQAVYPGSANTPLAQNAELTASVTSISVAFSGDLLTGNGLGSVTNKSNWQLLHYGIDVSNLITSITFGFDSAKHAYVAVVHFSKLLDDGGYQLVAKQMIFDRASSPLNSDGNGLGGSDYKFNFMVANVVPAGGETKVNTTTGGAQNHPSIAMDANGDYVVVWASYGHDGSGYGVYGQRYKADGTALGGEFRVNAYTKGAQENPTVAMDSAGDFVVTWQSFGQDGSSFGIYARRYDANGAAVGGEFRVNSVGKLSQVSPTIAMDSAGDFVISWIILNSMTTSDGVYAQRYNAAGVAQGSNFAVSKQLGVLFGPIGAPIAMDSVGDFDIFWNGHVQRYKQDGTALGGAITIAAQMIGHPAIAMDASGDFVVTWYQQNVQGHSNIFAQRFDSAGTPRSGVFQVSSGTTHDARLPTVAMDAAGDFVIAWNSYGPVGVYAKRYSADGTAQGAEFKVDTNAGFTFEDRPVIGMDARGDYVVAYKIANDGQKTGIAAQRFQIDISPFLSHLESTTLTETPSLDVLLSSSLTVTDLDNAFLLGATIRIGAGYQNGQDMLDYFGQSNPNITAAWDATTGTLTLSGKDSAAAYTTALHNVAYRNFGANPNSAATRRIDMSVTDGLLSSNLVWRNLKVVGLPHLAGGNSTVNYTGSPAKVFPNLVVTDPSSATLMKVTIELSNWSASDQLNVGLTGMNVATSLAFDPMDKSAEMTIQAFGTVAQFQALLRSMTYSSTSAHPTAGVRVATMAVSDGVYTSNSQTVNINVG